METRILAGTYPPGSTIPSEHSLCDEFGVGRPTVRQATDELVRKGLIERRRGSGTFVRNRFDAIDLFSLGGTIRSFHDRGVSLETRILGKPQISSHEDGRPGLRLQRLGLIANRPLLLEEFWFDTSVFDGLESIPLAGQSLSNVIHTRYGLVPLGADQAFSAIDLKPAHARLLRTRPRTAALCVERSLHFSIARDAVFVRMLCKQNDHFTFFQTIGGHSA